MHLFREHPVQQARISGRGCVLPPGEMNGIPRAEAAQGLKAPRSLSVESGCARLFTQVYERPGAETVILLHGGPGVPMDFSPITLVLAKRYQVVAFDQRGTGRSPAPGAAYGMAEYLEDIENIARSLKVDRFHLFGHSWGGLYAQIYAEKHPERILSIFLCSPSSGTGELWELTEREVMGFNRSRSGIWSWSMMGLKSALGMAGSDAAYRSLFKQVLENYNLDWQPGFRASDAMVEHVRAAPINRTRAAIAAYPPLRDPAGFEFPILLTYGQKDIYGASRALVSRRLPRAKVIEIKGTGHLPWLHNPSEFERILSDFYLSAG